MIHGNIVDYHPADWKLFGHYSIMQERGQLHHISRYDGTEMRIFDRQLGFVRNFFFKKGARVSLIDKAITFFEDDLFPLAAEAA